MAGSVSPDLMAARLKQIARDQKRVTRRAAMSVLRDAVGRRLFGTVTARGTWRAAYWTGRKATMRSLGLNRRTMGRDRTGAKWTRWRRDYKRGRDAAARARARGGSGIPLIVRITRTRWNGEVLQTGVATRGAAAFIEQGQPFSHGGKVQARPALQKAVAGQQARLGSTVKAAVDGFLAGALGG